MDGRLFVRPIAKDGSGEAGKIESPSEGLTKLEATQRYYKSLMRMIDDVRVPKGKTIGATRLWMDRYAKKIDRLPILGVDEDLVNLGAYVAGNLRFAANAYRDAGIQYSSQRGSTATGKRYSYGNYGSFRYTAAESEGSKQNAAIYRQIHSQAASQRLDIWRDIGEETAKIRRLLTQRYNVEF